MRKNPKREDALEPALSPRELFKLFPKTQLSFHTHPTIFNITGKDSSTLQIKQRIKLIAAIWADRNSGHAGSIVTHGTDTMATTTCVLAYAFGNLLSKPLFVTGSQLTAEELGTDAIPNFGRALRGVLEAKHPGVYQSFHDHLHWGTRLMKTNETKLAAFDSPSSRPVAEMTAHGLDWDHERAESLMPTEGMFLPYFSPHVAVASVEGDMASGELKRVLGENTGSRKCHGVIVQAPGTGNIAPHHLSLIRKALKSNIPVVVATQMQGGRIIMSSYGPGRRALKAGVIAAHDMTPPAARVKLSWALGMADELIRRKQMTRDDVVDFVSEVFKNVRAGEVRLPKGGTSQPLPQIVHQLDLSGQAALRLGAKGNLLVRQTPSTA